MFNRIHSPLGLLAPAKKDPPPTQANGSAVAKPDSFEIEALGSVQADRPATAEGIEEDAIREKVSAGLTRKQAVTVIEIQRAEDAEKAKAKKAG